MLLDDLFGLQGLTFVLTAMQPLKYEENVQYHELPEAEAVQ